MSSRTTRLASGLTWTLVTKFAIVKPRAAAAAGDGTTASRTASATSARAIPSAPERDAGRLPLSGAVELEVSPRVALEEGRDEVRREGLHRVRAALLAERRAPPPPRRTAGAGRRA